MIDKFISTILLYFLVSTVYAQNTSGVFSQSTLGFNFGLNHSNLSLSNSSMASHKVSNGLGFRLGVLADYPLSESLNWVPKVELSINNSTYEINHSQEGTTIYEVMPTTLEFSSHVNYKFSSNAPKLYLLFGPTLKVPVGTTKTSNTIDTYTDLAIDIGLGWDENELPYFNFSPEIRYSSGLIKRNKRDYSNALFMHNITLVLNIKG